MQIISTGPRKSDKYIPWYFVAFFVLLFIWEGVFVYTATSTHTGVVEDNTYNRGRNYNETIAQSDAQNALAWNSSLSVDNNGLLHVALTDANGTALAGARAVAYFFRPTQAGNDFTVTLGEASPGIYQTDTAGTSPGQWDVRIFVQWKQQRYQMAERIVVPKR